jgi:hypothetical protein
MYGCQCPKRLYLHKFHKDLANPQDELQQAVFDSGTDAGLLARTLFDGGIDASPPDAFQYASAAQKTQEYLHTHDVIYEATFIRGGVMCAVDILVREKGGWHAYEVKGTNRVKSQHETDAALQYAVITGSGLELSNFSIVHFNSSYVRVGAIDVHQLFTTESVLDRILGQQEFIEQKIGELKKVLTSKSMPLIEVGKQCEKPYPCNFSNYCFKDIEVETTQPEGEITIDVNQLSQFMGQVQYPIYHFDFETLSMGVPPFDYSSPWQQIPFQYSVHIQSTSNGTIEHRYFLGDGLSDPREELIQQMITDLGETGTILCYYKPFEMGRLQELSECYPKYAPEIEAIMKRVVDLIEPFKKGMVTIPATQGSNSIKNVLPALIPELSYTDLVIQEGGTASFTYTQLASMPLDMQAQTRTDLLAYCELDTWAMVCIWEWLNKNCDTRG